MSRIGRAPIEVPSEVDVNVDGTHIRVKGPKGELARDIHPSMRIDAENGELTVNRNDNLARHRALHGLTRTLIANMIEGVTQGYEKSLEIKGVGYRAALQGKKLVLSVGFSHPVEMNAPEGIEFEVPEPTKIKVRGINKELVGETTANIRAVRPPEPYLGKGIMYAGERIRRKAGKAGKVGT